MIEGENRERVTRLVVGPTTGGEGREWTTSGTSGLRVAFRCGQTSAKSPNKGEFTIYNLSPDSRSFVSRESMAVQFGAGYVTPSLLFVGDITRPISERESADWLTKIEAGDGQRKYATGTLEKTWSTQQSCKKLFKEVAASAEFEVRDDELAQLEDVLFPRGYAALGSIHTTLDDLAGALGAGWSIVNGVLQILPIDADNGEEAVVVSPDTGLVGSPKPTKKGIEFETLLNPKLRARRPIVLDSRDYKGIYVARRVVHYGDSGYATEFYTKVQARLRR